MMWTCRVPVLLLVLLSSLLAATVKADDDDGKIVRFSFRFGFFDDELTPVTEVIKEDVEAVVCQTQYFLSQLVQNATETKSVHAKATEIDWGYFENQDLPAHINFTVEFTDAAIEGDVNWVDDQILIDQMEGLGEAGLQDFITNWVWKAEPVDLNFFKNANRMAFDGERQAPVDGNLEEAECPATIAPTMAPTVSPAPTTESGDIMPPPTVAADGGAGEGDDLDDTDPEGAGAGNATEPDGEGGLGAGGAGPNGEDEDDEGNPADEDGNPGGEDEDGNPGAGNGDGNGPLPDPTGSGPLPDPTGSGNGSNPDWPFGPNYATLSDLDPMTDYALSFSLFTDKERPPTETEVNNLLCEINDFYTAELRRELNDNTIHAKAVYIDYYFLEEGAREGEDIIVNFTTFAYYGDEKHTQVHADDVFEAMKVTDSELKSFVEDYVWKSEPEQENVFYNTESLSMNAGKGRPVNEKAMLVEALGCVLPPAHGDSGAIPPPAGAGTGNGPNNNGAAAVPGGDNQGLGGDAKSTRITTAFRVSNIENIKSAQSVKAEGLDQSFPSFVHLMVEEMTKRDSTRRLNKQRSLRVVAVTDSATVDSVIEFDCPDNALDDLTCHEVTATYDVLMTSDEDENQINNDYTDATNRAVNDGTYNNELQRTVPDTPLYIGIMTSEDQIPPGSQNDEDDDGWFKWWYILLLLLLLLLCCLLCLLCMKKDEREQEPETKVYEEREVLVEEFDDEDAPKDDDDDEEFVEDDAAAAPAPAPVPAGAMVPYQAPAGGAAVPYDAEASKKYHEDQAQREKILNQKKEDDHDKML